MPSQRCAHLNTYILELICVLLVAVALFSARHVIADCREYECTQLALSSDSAIHLVQVITATCVMTFNQLDRQTVTRTSQRQRQWGEGGRQTDIHLNIYNFFAKIPFILQTTELSTIEV